MAFSINIEASNVSLSVIKDSLITFLRKNEHFPSRLTKDNLPNELFTNPINGTHIKEKCSGIYMIPNLSTHGFTHYLLISKANFTIINMREPLGENIKKVIQFMKKYSFYSKEDVFFYISNLVDTNNQNELRESAGSMYYIE